MSLVAFVEDVAIGVRYKMYTTFGPALSRLSRRVRIHGECAVCYLGEATGIHGGSGGACAGLFKSSFVKSGLDFSRVPDSWSQASGPCTSLVLLVCLSNMLPGREVEHV